MRELTIAELKPLFEEFGLGPNFQGLTLIREIARLRVELAAQSGLVEAAKTYVANYIAAYGDDLGFPAQGLRDAVATYRAQEQK